MKARLLALTAGLMLIGAAPALADTGLGNQAAGQDASNMQSASSSAKSTQIDPSNENISVRVLSPGNDGDVKQSNNSSADSGALNANTTGQATSQVQSAGGAASKALQQAAQWAGNDQSATSSADSTQKDPSNENISVRVLSAGDNGSVDQSNNSDAKSFAGNKNGTMQTSGQDQGGGSTPTPKKSTRGSDTSSGGDQCGCNSGGSKSIQADGQDAASKQMAKSDATSNQIGADNQNDPVRVKSPGDNGSVDQSNNSDAKSFAGNLNKTMQTSDQSQAGMSGSVTLDSLLRGICGCSLSSLGIQAGGQDSMNTQDATSSGDSEQMSPTNDNLPTRTKESDGSNGDVSQQNNSTAESKAFNWNGLLQMLKQLQGGGAIQVV
jgi:hypothetical protein